MGRFTNSKTRVLFMCLGNDARSPMAEAWMNHLYGDRFEARSAGLEPGVIHPLAVRVMQEIGLDLSGHRFRRVFDLVKEGELFSYAVTIRDQGRNERPAFFPGFCIRLQWPFPDPVRVAGGAEQQLENLRGLRKGLKKKIEDWIAQLKTGKPILLPHIREHSVVPW